MKKLKFGKSYSRRWHSKEYRKPDAHHVLYDIYFDEYPKELDSVSKCRKLFEDVLREGDYKILHVGFHKFKPRGLTGFFLLSESHLSIHTWPEERYIAFDLFTCGKENDIKKALDQLFRELSRFKVAKIQKKRFKRGYAYDG